MLSRLRQSLIAVVAVVVLGLLWFVGNDKGDVVPVETGAAPSSQPASIPRGIPRNGTLDPISIDPERPADVLPQYQADGLFADYHDNAGEADDRYRGKPHRRRRGQRHPARRRQQRVPGNPHQQPG
jgi:hypothetical protein